MILSLKAHNPALIVKKTSGSPKSRDILQDTGRVLTQTAQGLKNKEYLRNCLRQEETEETEDQSVPFWMGAWNQKGH